MSTTAVPGPPAVERGESPARRAARRFLRHKLAVFGLVVVLVFVLLAAFAPWVAPYDPIETSWARIRRPPSAAHWFGTDENGRDVLSRLIWGRAPR
jgi:peptide/nickel transport system permease protein